MPFDREAICARLAEIASADVYLGTSSWKYPGWLGQLRANLGSNIDY